MYLVRKLLPVGLAVLFAGESATQIQFEPLVQIPLPDGAFDVDLVDLDDDGDLDILTSPSLDELFGTTVTYDVLEGLGGAEFAPPVAGQTLPYDDMGYGEAGDFDGDGEVEWILPRATVVGDALLFESTAGLTFGAPAPIGGTVANGQSELRVVDLLEDDRRLDAVMVGSNGFTGPPSAFVAIVADGVGGFTTVPGADLPMGGHRIAVGDLDGDGWQDVVVTNSTLITFQVHLATSPTSWGPGTTTGTGNSRPEQVELADVDGDGVLDALIGLINDGVLVLLGQGDGTFGPGQKYPSGEQVHSFVVADLDGDGALDMLVAHAVNKLTVLRGVGDGTFVAVETMNVTFCTGMDVGDMDGDGDLDVALALDLSFGFQPDAVGVLVNRSYGPDSPFTDLGFSSFGPLGTPKLFADGTLVPGSAASFDLIDGAPGQLGWFPIGLSALEIPFEGGVLVPSPDKVLLRVIDAAGRASVAGDWPQGVPSGTQLWVQWWFEDGGSPADWGASNALRIDVP